MRTTIDLPADLHQLATALARSRKQTLSQTIADVLRGALLTDETPVVTRDELTGLPRVRLWRPVTSEDVAALEDEG
ncbi:MAG TPA: hypothetical protein VFI47_21745 [Acidimicrobiales bacterium]|nr:hypothetical protein [Acidimicrobiales bacterium]